MKRLILVILFVCFSAFAKAQCAMCRAVIESSDNKSVAEGLNNGITYLMIFPYLIVGAIIYMIYRNTNK